MRNEQYIQKMTKLREELFMSKEFFLLNFINEPAFEKISLYSLESEDPVGCVMFFPGDF